MTLEQRLERIESLLASLNRARTKDCWQPAATNTSPSVQSWRFSRRIGTKGRTIGKDLPEFKYSKRGREDVTVGLTPWVIFIKEVIGKGKQATDIVPGWFESVDRVAERQEGFGSSQLLTELIKHCAIRCAQNVVANVTHLLHGRIVTVWAPSDWNSHVSHGIVHKKEKRLLSSLKVWVFLPDV